MGWPDIVIAIVVGLGTVAGLRRGLIGELSGALAFGAALVAAFSYSGVFDGFVRTHSQLGPGSAHVVGLLAFALLAYGIVLGAGLLLSTIAKLPLLNLVNAIGGAAIGFFKSVLFVWVALYVVLFFPLPRDLRNDLHDSYFAQRLEAPNHDVDVRMRDNLPWYLRPVANILFGRHHA